MGTDCAPLLANRFYEYKYVKDKLKESHRDAVLFGHTVRYIDDLLTINNPTFEQEIPKIYPPQLTLKKTTETPEKFSYLDICLQIQGKKFKTSVYDRLDTEVEVTQANRHRASEVSISLSHQHRGN